MKILATISGKNSKKFKVIGSNKTACSSIQFLMPLPYMIVLSHKSLVLIMKNEIYGQKSRYLTQNIGKTNFLSNEIT
jgi:hypothetical protein